MDLNVTYVQYNSVLNKPHFASKHQSFRKSEPIKKILPYLKSNFKEDIKDFKELKEIKSSMRERRLDLEIIFESYNDIRLKKNLFNGNMQIINPLIQTVILLTDKDRGPSLSKKRGGDDFKDNEITNPKKFPINSINQFFSNKGFITNEFLSVKSKVIKKTSDEFLKKKRDRSENSSTRNDQVSHDGTRYILNSIKNERDGFNINKNEEFEANLFKRNCSNGVYKLDHLNYNINEDDNDDEGKPLNCVCCNWRFPSNYAAEDVNTHINLCLDGKTDSKKSKSKQKVLKMIK